MIIPKTHLETGKYALGMHTTTPELGLVISNFADDTRSGVWKLERELSNLIHGYLIDLVKPQTWSDLSFIAVAKGPGGFTGTRIGIVAARTFGQQLDIPDRKSTRLNSSHVKRSRMPSSA